MSSRARCPRCGEGVRGAPAFCPTCGTRLAGADAPAVEVDLFGDGVNTTAGSTELVFDAPGRRRGRTVGAGVAAVLALAVGVSVAAGGGSGQTRAPTSTTTPATTSTTTASVWSSPSTTSDAPTTTTTLGPVSLGAGPLFGETTGLSALTMLSSYLYRIDLDTGIAVPVPNGPVSGDAVQGILTSIGLLVGDQNGSLRLVRAGSTGPTPLIGAGPGGADVSLNGASYIGEGPPGRLWLMTYDEHGQHVGYVEPLRDGGFGEVPMTVSTGGARADGLGALLFTAPGGAYRVEPGGSPRRFREGYVVGATAGRALTLECDA